MRAVEMRRNSGACFESSITRRAVLIGGAVGVAGALLFRGPRFGELDAPVEQDDPVTDQMVENTCAL